MSKLSFLFVALGLSCLVLAAVFLMIGHSPESYVANQQAETLANFAYGLIFLGVVMRLAGDR